MYLLNFFSGSCILSKEVKDVLFVYRCSKRTHKHTIYQYYSNTHFCNVFLSIQSIENDEKTKKQLNKIGCNLKQNCVDNIFDLVLKQRWRCYVLIFTYKHHINIKCSSLHTHTQSVLIVLHPSITHHITFYLRHTQSMHQYSIYESIFAKIGSRGFGFGRRLKRVCV